MTDATQKLGNTPNEGRKMTGQEARDDEREALIAILDDPANWWYNGTHTVFSPSRGADALVAAGYRKHPEPEWEYAIRVSGGGGHWTLPQTYESEAAALARLPRPNCVIVRREKAGEWQAMSVPEPAATVPTEAGGR